MLVLIKIINLVAATIGIMQSLLPLIKEVIVACIRLIDTIGALFGKDLGIKWVKTVDTIFNSIYEVIEETKNSFMDREEMRANNGLR